MARFWIVDVFTQTRYTGNQLAVVLDSGRFDAEHMQSIAREMNFSETTFLAPAPSDGAWPTRIFTPRSELPFAGHPTLGTAQVVAFELGASTAAPVVLAVPAGRVPVVFGDDGAGWLTPPPPEFGKVHDPALLARALGLTVEQIDTDYPVQTLCSPFSMVFVPLRDRRAAEQASYQPGAIEALRAAGAPTPDW
jgi:trans-2,3-dihydro-3-hydroxyanthranilate isomerase